MLSQSSHSNSIADWRSRSGIGHYREAKGGGSFNRLHQDGLAGSGEHGLPEEPWRHKAHVRGGRTKGEDADSVDDFAIGDDEQGWSGSGGAKAGIRVRTTVTVTEKVDWLDDLY